MRVLLIGANGFIGSNVRRFLAGRHSIVGADIDTPRMEGDFQIAPDHPDFLWLIERSGADAVVNCSGAASVPASFESPLHDYTLNTIRVAQMLEAIRLSKRCIRFVQLSSAAVYGNPAQFPVSESCMASPVSPYGWHKRQAEMVCEEYSSLYGVETSCLRIFSAYGPGLRKQVFWDVFRKSLRSPQIEMFGTGNEARDFIYVDDVAEAIDCVLQRGVFDGRAVNVGSGYSTTVRDAVETLLHKLGSSSTLVFKGEGRRGDPERWQADIEVLQAMGFEPRFNVQLGLERTAQWLQDQQ
jgi:UDP-glucose 4-epimerase